MLLLSLQLLEAPPLIGRHGRWMAANGELGRAKITVAGGEALASNQLLAGAVLARWRQRHHHRLLVSGRPLLAQPLLAPNWLLQSQVSRPGPVRTLTPGCVSIMRPRCLLVGHGPTSAGANAAGRPVEWLRPGERVPVQGTSAPIGANSGPIGSI